MNRIVLKSAVAPTLSSRDIVEVVQTLVDKLNQRRVVIDFSGMTFVSRSAADELLKLQERFSGFFSNKKINFENIPTEVAQILALVKKQQHNPRRHLRPLESTSIKEFD
ncbi:MAG: hypothetical protein WC289_01130 [Patescibacteria group bacterium]|jgi:anti-anti-sigma regulatory factor